MDLKLFHQMIGGVRVLTSIGKVVYLATDENGRVLNAGPIQITFDKKPNDVRIWMIVSSHR
jgi:hypothetical protein